MKVASPQQFKRLSRKTSFMLCLALIRSSSEPAKETCEDPILKEFKEVFLKTLPEELPPGCHIHHHINLVPGAQPVARPPYRMPGFEIAYLKKGVLEMLERGIHSTSSSPRAAYVLFAKKKGGELRFSQGHLSGTDEQSF